NSPLIDPVGGAEFGISIEGNGHFEANANVNIGGDLDLSHSATLIIRSFDTMTVRGDANFKHTSEMSIETDGVLIIEGNMDLKQQNSNTVNGKIYVKGNITANQNATIDGTGNVEAEGDVDLSNGTTFFGSSSGCTSGCEYGSGEGLPIELNYFKAHVVEDQLNFQWQTLSELNNHYFEVEYSANGKDFSPIFRLEGAGNSNQIINYQKSVPFQNPATGYYRLKQTDFDGKYSYSEVKYIGQVAVTPQEINIYPNPSDGTRLFVELINFKPDEYSIDILDSRGQLVMTKAIRIENESIYFEIELLHGKQLNHGVYYLRISSFEDRMLKKVVVE
ncbi:MAG: T9SS type A sorting domain-containing protein, partial [Vicingaceae bacterium]